MDILTTALNALAAQQAIQATRRTARNGLTIVALLPAGIGVLLIGLAFLAFAAYSAMALEMSSSMAAVIVAAGCLLVTLCIALAGWLMMERTKNAPPPAPDIDLAPLADIADKITDEVKKSPGSSMLLAAVAGAVAYVLFTERR